MTERIDIILFGATGLTGKYCVLSLYHLTRAFPNKYISWGVAGRSKEKLEKTLADCQKKLGFASNLRNIPIVVADLSDSRSLKNMTGSARIVVNCVGPYRLFGEPVIEACIATGTHQVDVCGEPEYMEKIQLKYHELAREKGVYIINSCGFDSLISELGVLFLEKNFEGTLNSVESFIQKRSKRGMSTNVATWESAVLGFGSAADLKGIRNKLHTTKLPNFLPKLRIRSEYERNQLINGEYAAELPSCDRSVIARSRRFLWENRNIRPIQYAQYFAVQTRWGLFLLSVYGKVFRYLVKSDEGKNLLLKFPELFSNGYFKPAEKISEEDLERTSFTYTFLGTGWDVSAPKLANDPHNFKDLPDKTIIASIEGYNGSYGVASCAATLAAITVLLEEDKLPTGGGVYTPGAAFFNTSIIEKFRETNIVDYKIKSKL